MIFRRKGREFALQSLYALELGQGELADFEDAVISGLGAKEEAILYGKKLIHTVLDHVLEIDDTIMKFAKNWTLDRIAVIDKILMRCSMAEMLYIADIPVKVSITEAIQMAKKYSTKESADFINGVLDAAAKDITHAKEL
jgi:N utilization substance protein B